MINLAVAQFTPRFGQKQENLNRMADLIGAVTADVVVFPELCTTGYFFTSRQEVEAVAEPADGSTFQFLRRLADASGALIVAGFAEKHESRLYNACLIVEPGGRRPQVYRKTHLFYKETLCFDPGDSGFFVVPLPSRDVVVGPMICYDWRFPESARVLTLLGADVIVCPSNLVTTAWQVVMPARAVENKVYLAVANRAGTEERDGEKLTFRANSVIYDFEGRVLKQAEGGGDQVLVATVQPSETRDKFFNPINNVLLDRKPHHYRRLTAALRRPKGCPSQR
jgi:predicted amidohydrolase